MNIIDDRADSLEQPILERGHDDVIVEETYNKFMREPSLIINIKTFDKVLIKYPDIINFRSISKLIDFLFNQPQPTQRKNMIISMIKAWNILKGAYDSLEGLTYIYKSISKKKKELMAGDWTTQKRTVVNLITDIQNAIIDKMFYVQFGENIDLSDYFISINNKLEAKTNLEPEDIGRIFILSEALDDKLSYYLKYIISNLHEWKLLKREEPEYENNSTAIIEIKLLLERGAELNIMDEKLIDIIDEKIKDPDEDEDYIESYNIIKGILLNAMAIQLILATPMTLKRTNPGVDLGSNLDNGLKRLQSIINNNYEVLIINPLKEQASGEGITLFIEMIDAMVKDGITTPYESLLIQSLLSIKKEGADSMYNVGSPELSEKFEQSNLKSIIQRIALDLLLYSFKKRHPDAFKT